VTETRPDWDEYFMKITETVALRGDCTRRQVGCVIVDQDHRILATGYNGAVAGAEGCLEGACPRGQATQKQLDASEKNYDFGRFPCIAIHAEANALLYARASCKGATLYVNKQPCPACWRLILAAGITRTVYPPLVGQLLDHP